MRDVEAGRALRPVTGVGDRTGRTSALDASERAALLGAPADPVDGPDTLAPPKAAKESGGRGEGRDPASSIRKPCGPDR
ncbi:hypothetical protein ACFXEL_36725 [Streptomyces sp. NPDC059382]|uniref:hypothetical protein n=1 Tax=Streptomyces sp. NPDC059382 TaxID=3346816 RepID=UPI0036AFD365